MSDPYIGQITLFAGNFAPSGWAKCEGQLLNIASNTALFSLVGTTYGGNGETTFALPDLRGRVPIHAGAQGPGLSNYQIGQKGGAENVQLTANQLPPHAHAMRGNSGGGDNTSPIGGYPASSSEDLYAESQNGSMGTTANAGGNQAHENRPPFLGITFIIALVGIFPSS